MEPLPPAHLLLLHEMLQETAIILEFPIENVLNVFYCGRAQKWGLPTTLLVIIKDDDDNRFHDEMSTPDGSGGSCYLSKRIDKNHSGWSGYNRPYQFRYRVLFERVFNGVASYNVIFDNEWVSDNNPYKGGLSILEEMQRLDELIAFA